MAPTKYFLVCTTASRMAREPCGKAQVVAVLEFFPIDVECFASGFARVAIPAVGEDDTADIPEQCSDAWHGRVPFGEGSEYAPKDSTSVRESVANASGFECCGSYRYFVRSMPSPCA